MKFFPVNLNLKDRLCVIVGAGKVGERKAFDLLDYTSKIRIIGLNFTEKIINNRAKFEIIKSEYRKEFLKNSFLVFACTDNRELNLKIYKDAKEIGAFVNIATHPELCDFTVPSVVNRGKVKIAISTDGVSPALSRILKEKISELIGEEYEFLAEIMEKIRKKQLKISTKSDKNREKFYKFLKIIETEDLKERDIKKINIKIKEIFGFEI